MLHGRLVAPLVDAGIALVKGPVCSCGGGRDPMVPPLAEEVHGWVMQCFEVGQEIGAATEAADKLLPAGSLSNKAQSSCIDVPRQSLRRRVVSKSVLLLALVLSEA